MKWKGLYIFGLLWILISCNSQENNSENAVSADTFSMNADTLPDKVDGLEVETDTLNIPNPSENEPKPDKPLPGKATAQDNIATKILGKWKWEKTHCCGRNAQTYTDTLNENKILHFKSGGKVEFYENGKLQKVENYSVEENHDHLKRPAITIGEETLGPAILEIEGDKMMINYGYMDLQIEYYKRVK